jgi:uncharacterized protein YjbI with pentapeptide repeats
MGGIIRKVPELEGWVSGMLRRSALPGHPAREEPRPSRQPGRRQWLIAVAVALVAVAVLWMVLFLPRYLLSWDLAGGTVGPGGRAAAVNAIRSTLMQGAAGLAVLAGLFFTWRQVQDGRQGQVTDRYTRAIDQLGQSSPELRVGGIYALERIARDSAMDRRTIVEVLATFIRLQSPLSPGADERPRPADAEGRRAFVRGMTVVAPLRDRAPHIQAAITVLGRVRSADKRARGWLARVDLVRSDLGYCDLAGADLHYSDLSQSFVLGADLRRADLTGTWFVSAMLDQARLHQADLRSAVFWEARLRGADLRAADLTGADFTGALIRDASLDLADLRGADFTASDITGATFRGAVADDTTTWPAGFDPQQAGVLTADEAPPLRPQSYSADPQIT